MARPPNSPAPSVKKQLTADEIRAGIARLKSRREELDRFDPNTMSESFPPELNALCTSITRALEKTFGEGTSDFKRFADAGDLGWSSGILILNGPPTPLSDYQNGVANNIAQSRALLDTAIRTLEEDLQEIEGPSSTTTLPVSDDVRSKSSRKVFIVHGHDEGPREAVARFLSDIAFEPIILHERPNKGRTIISKFREEAAEVGFAVILMTPDDVGKAKDQSDARPRARQNVVFELGFFIGALGPDRVAALVKGEIERPSDYDGVIYISFDKEGWQTKLGQELEAAGYEVDWNSVMRRKGTS